MLENLQLIHRGKTRDTYRAKWSSPNDTRRPPRLIVASDRISTHNIVHQSTIPKKGEVLTALTVRWIEDLRGEDIDTHLIAFGKNIYDYLPGKEGDYPKNFHHRAIVVKDLDMIPVEFIYRAYLCGSLWDKYYSKGLENPYGIKLGPDLPLMYRFTRPIFTPTEKSDTDEPLNHLKTHEEYRAVSEIGRSVLTFVQRVLRRTGVEMIDTKLEFGVDEHGALVLADEVLTPDSSRFVRRKDIREGENPPWLDKQVARDWAEKKWAGGLKEPLIFPPMTINQLKETYVDLFEMVSRMSLSQFQREVLDQ
ncbi:MAG: phosphoribosylaminoimidazolesuccinocarboxamide synthase [Candidatus Pacebacteria bacterium]|nr:phosphoribosylaminoimidazolesuccinocarboxamide synthase [Candidatus Paceibacterota bacterium]